jgi:hypothetical protein
MRGCFEKDLCPVEHAHFSGNLESTDRNFQSPLHIAVSGSRDRIDDRIVVRVPDLDLCLPLYSFSGQQHFHCLTPMAIKSTSML